MLEEILAHVNNYFVVDIKKGGYEISNGTISLPFLKTNQYFRIRGSLFNDGVYKYHAANLTDEEFDGEIWAMAVPPAVIALASTIQAWMVKNPKAAYTSESFGGYSYSKATNTQTGLSATWQDVFRNELNRWRKI
jgi:hypothetical protein